MGKGGFVRRASVGASAALGAGYRWPRRDAGVPVVDPFSGTRAGSGIRSVGLSAPLDREGSYKMAFVSPVSSRPACLSLPPRFGAGASPGYHTNQESVPLTVGASM